MPPSSLQSDVVLGLFRGEVPPTFAPGTDARAWRADSLRAARLAQATLERLPVSAAWLIGDSGGWNLAIGLPGSQAFEEVVRAKRRLLDAAIEHFESRVPLPLLLLERALAFASDRLGMADGGRGEGSVRLAPGVSVVDVPAGLSQTYGIALEAVRGNEHADRWASILAAASMNTARRGLRFDGEDVRLMVVPDPTEGATVEVVEGPLGRLLWFLRPTRHRTEVGSYLVETEGLEPPEVDDLLEDLAGQGIVLLGSVRAEAP